MYKLISLFCFILILLACKEEKKTFETTAEIKVRTPDAISLFGDSLFSATPSEKLLERVKIHKENYLTDSTDADNLIWYGRFVAYKGDYKNALEIFSKGIEKYPEDARFYRHRGHRYITIRKYDLAIADYENAIHLIEGKPNVVEPDGMPNARNIPVSTLHGNIYYHLGLAHYLNWDLEKSLDAYKKCLATGTKPDSVVSATHWIYMILRILKREDEAKNYLESINSTLPTINFVFFIKEK